MSTITDNISIFNSGNGIAVNGCTVIGNTCYNNDEYGIYANGNRLIDQNTASANNYPGSEINLYSTSDCTLGINHTPSPSP